MVGKSYSLLTMKDIVEDCNFGDSRTHGSNARQSQNDV